MLYGSDLTGLVYGYVFAPGQAGRPLDSEAAAQWLAREDAQPEGEFAWLHFSLSNANTRKWLGESLHLPEEFYEALRESTGSTRVDRAGEHVLALVNDVDYDFSFESGQIATMWICVDERLMVSVRLHPLRSVERLRQCVRDGEEFASPLSILAHLLRDQAEVLQRIVRNATARLDAIEETLLAGRVLPKRYALGSLRRVLVRLRRLLSPEPRALHQLLHRPPAWFAADDASELRDARDEFTGVLEELTLLQERAKLLQEEIVAHTNEQTNRSVFLLTMVTVIALPVNMVAGLLGMNVGGVPLNQDPEGFWYVLGLVAAITGVAGWLAFFRRRED